LYTVFLSVLQLSPVSIIPPFLHTHSFIYHPYSIRFFSQYFSFLLSVSFHNCSILIHLATNKIVYCFSLSTSVFPCQYHSTIAPYSFIHLSLMLYNVFLPVLPLPSVSITPPLLHTHSSIYHPCSIMFFSQYFIFSISIITPFLHTHLFIYHPTVYCFSHSALDFPCQFHLTTAPYSFTHLPTALFFSEYFGFSLSVSFHHCSILIHSSTTHTV